MACNYQGKLDDSRALSDRLTAAGLSRSAARAKARLFASAAAALPVGNTADRRAFFVPGRVEVLGKHTDYAGGRSMVAAVERGFCIVAAPRDDALITVVDADARQRISFALHPPPTPRAGHWSNYPMTVARRVAVNFPEARRGADVVLAGDLPPAAGMSSSSSLIVAVFLVLADANQLPAQRRYRDHVGSTTDLAGYLGAVENGRSFGSLEGDCGVGTFGGSEDHTAILCAEPNHVSQYTYCPVRFDRSMRVPSGHTFAIGSSGVVAEKTGAARQQYNRASRMAVAVAQLWCRATGRDDPHLAAAFASSPDAVDRLREIVARAEGGEFAPAALSDRLEHFVVENEQIIPAAGDALDKEDLGEFGRLVDASQQAAEQLLGNQVPETVYLAASARERGAVAASAFGAGFGGSVWAMVETSRAETFLTGWAKAYRNRFPQHAPSSQFFLTGAGPAAFQLR